MKLQAKEKHYIKIALLTVTLSILIYQGIANIGILRDGLMFLLGIAMPFLMGLAFAFIVNMPMQFIERKVVSKLFPDKPGIARVISLVVAYLTVIAVIVFIFIAIIPQLVESIQLLAVRIPPFLEQTVEQLRNYEPAAPVVESIEKQISEINAQSIWDWFVNFMSSDNNNVVGGILGTIGGIFSGFLNVFLALVFSLYCLMSKETLIRQTKEILYSLTSEKFGDAVLYVSYTGYDNFFNFFTGQFVEAIVLGVMCFIGMNILQIPYAIVISVLVAFGALIPMVGAFFAGLVGTLLLMIETPLQAVTFLIFIVILQQFDGNLVYPRIVGKSVGLPAMWVLVAIVVGGATFGVLGMLMFVPIASTAYDLMTDFKNRRLVERGIRISEK